MHFTIGPGRVRNESDLDGEDLDSYCGILEALRKAIPQQWG
jgi:hypothetical protein